MPLRPALAFRKSQGRDSWSKYEIHHRPTELAIRWDYTIRDDTTGKGVWESSETLIKMEGTSFAKGAMRACYRMKKMSQVSAAFFYKVLRRMRSQLLGRYSLPSHHPKWQRNVC